MTHVYGDDMSRELLSIRCPVDVLDAVAERVVATGMSKTDIVLNLLRVGLQLPSIEDTTSTVEVIDERIENALAPIKEELSRLSAVISLVQSNVESIPPDIEENASTFNVDDNGSCYPINIKKYVTRQDLGKIYDVKSGSVGRWEENGRLQEHGWVVLESSRKSSAPNGKKTSLPLLYVPVTEEAKTRMKDFKSLSQSTSYPLNPNIDTMLNYYPLCSSARHLNHVGSPLACLAHQTAHSVV